MRDLSIQDEAAIYQADIEQMIKNNIYTKHLTSTGVELIREAAALINKDRVASELLDEIREWYFKTKKQ